MKKDTKLTLLALASALGLAGAAHGQTYTITYDFTGEPGNQASTAGAALVDGAPTALITDAIVDRGDGLNATNANNSISSSGWDDLASDDFFSFRFTIDAGTPLDFATLALATRSSNTGPGSLAVRSSLDSFASDLFTFSQSGTTVTSASYDISGLTGVTGSVEFRIFSTSTTSANGGTVGSGGTFRINSAEFSTVPEPGTYALLAGMLGLGYVMVRRRRQA